MADFRVIRQHVTMADVLAHYRIELRGANGKTRVGKCPLPQHSSSDRDTFKVVRGDRGWSWSCHSQSCVAARNEPNGKGDLKRGGSFVDLVRFMENCSLGEAGDKLEAWFGPFSSEAGVVITKDAEVPAANDDEATENVPLAVKFGQPDYAGLQGIQPVHPYLTYRGFDEEECAYLGVGFFAGKGMMRNRIVFPIHNVDGQLVGYAGRRIEYSLHDENPEHIAPETDSLDAWKFPPGFLRGSEVYNIHRVSDPEVILVESFFGVLACIRAGILNVVAIMTNNITDRQADLIQSRFKRVTVMLDGDLPGRQGVGQVVGKLVLADVEHVDIALLPKGMRPPDLSAESLRQLLRIADFPASWRVVEDAATA